MIKILKFNFEIQAYVVTKCNTKCVDNKQEIIKYTFL